MKRRTVKRTRRHRGGFYEFKGALGPGAPAWGQKSEMGPLSAGNINKGMQYGRGRKHKKRRSTRRKMRGGGGTKFGGVAASFTGTGERGMANYGQSNTKFPPFGPAAGGAFNNAGAAPGNFSSFKGMFPQ